MTMWFFMLKLTGIRIAEGYKLDELAIFGTVTGLMRERKYDDKKKNKLEFIWEADWYLWGKCEWIQNRFS